MPDSSSAPASPTAFTPFAPEAHEPHLKDVAFARLAPRAEPEPPVEHGIDLSGQAKIVFAAGRGKAGKTTLLRWYTEMSLQQGGAPILADIDPSHATLSTYFNDVARPETDHPAGVARWLQELIEHCAATRASAIVDLGGGDTTLRTLATEMPGLVASIEASGLAPVILYMLGPQPEDLTPALTLTERGFAPQARALVLNEFTIEPGITRARAFERIMNLPGFVALAKTSVRVWMPRLFAAEAIEARQCRFFEALARRVVPPLGMFDGARLRAWLDAMERRFAGIRSWIP
jgi:hypothetical protein